MFDGFSSLADTIYTNKYAMQVNGRKEVWPETAERVARSVMDPYMPHLSNRMRGLIEDRKVIPGGRYLYAAGRPYPQVNSCFLMRAEDSREGWANMMGWITNSLMTGGGIGVVYSDLRPSDSGIKGMGGKSTGPCALMQMVNEAGRHIVQGGSRRSACWSGVHWYHPDVMKFISLKEWDPITREGKRQDFNFPAPMDGTNISVILDDEFFAAYHNPTWSKSYKWGHTSHTVTHKTAQSVYWACVRGMLRTGEPGFSIDIGENAGENCRNACVTPGTEVLTREGYRPIRSLVGQEVAVWNGMEWSTVVPRQTGMNQPLLRVKLSDGRSLTCTPNHEWLIARQGTGESRVKAWDLKGGERLVQFKLPVMRGNRPTDSLEWSEDVRIESVTPAGFGEEVFCFNEPKAHRGTFAGIVTGQCTEVSSDTNLDMCNLASLNMARLRSKEEFTEAMDTTIAFLLCGTLYSKLPVPEMYNVREKNRRLGLGLMGMHEWMLQRGQRYGESDELAEWMDVYCQSDKVANKYSDQLGISRPVATRSVAPNGTISIIAETTSGIEPIFSVALKRRYLDGRIWKAQYIVDPTAQRLIKEGVDPELIEDSMTLAEDYERRIRFQGWLQSQFIDHSTASTVNLPQWGSSINNENTVNHFGKTLFKYLPQLRGITTYPNGARDGQPLVPTPYREAIKHLGREFEDGSVDAEEAHEETADFLANQTCKAGGVCGS